MDNNPAAVIELADVEFWPATGRLCCGARSARLTGQPSRMLELLLRHRGVLVTRDQLMVALYAHRTGQPADPKILDVWMLRIRRLLCALGSAIEIKTVFGRGFVTAGAAMQPARAELIAALQARTQGNHETRLLLRGDQHTEYGQLMAVMNQLQSDGYTKIGLVAEEESGQ